MDATTTDLEINIEAGTLRVLGRYGNDFLCFR